MRELSKRGNLMAGIAIGLLVAGLIWLSGNLWYVEGEGYCIGTLAQCFHQVGDSPPLPTGGGERAGTQPDN